MEKTILVRYSEIFLKSPPVFRRLEDLLIANIKRVLRGKKFRLEKGRGRIFIYTPKPQSLSKKLKYVFGIYSFSPAFCLKTTSPLKIKKFVKETYEKEIGENQSFALRVRSDEKNSSQKLATEVGKEIERKVDLSSPDKEIFIEVKEGKTYIFDEVIRGLGGMPVGSSGSVLSLISGGIDSPVACWMMMKRGCRVNFVHFHSFPLVSKKSYFKTKTLCRILSKYQGRAKIYFVPFAPIQTWLKTNIFNKYLVIFYRRLMLKIAQEIAKKQNIKVLTTGESLAQVASQTLDNLAVIGQAVKIPVLRPLIGFDKEEIVGLAKEIGTYETSIEYQEDCCSLFVPRHPATKASLEKILEEEKKIPLENMIKEALDKTEIVVMK